MCQELIDKRKTAGGREKTQGSLRIQTGSAGGPL